MNRTKRRQGRAQWRYPSPVTHLLKRMRERLRTMFEPSVPQPGGSKDPNEDRLDATSKMNVDAPTNYVKSYDEHRPQK
jgi:hypothetical protein